MLEQVDLFTVNFTLNANHIYIGAKIFIIILFLTAVLLMKGSFNNPFIALCGNTKLMKHLEKFLIRAKYTIEWTLFTKMQYYSYDLRLTAITECGVKYEWFMIRDGANWMDGRFKIKFAYSRTVLSTHYFNLFKKFLNPYFVDAATEYCTERDQNLISLVIEQVSFYSLSSQEELDSRMKPLNVTRHETLI